MIRTGVNVGYSDEFRDRETNTPLLESIAELAGQEGRAGQVDSAAAGGAGGRRPRPSRSCSRSWP